MKKYYIKPSVATMEIETTSIMAGSTGVNGDGSQGGIDNPKPCDGSISKHAPSRIYFDSWGYDDDCNEEYDY
ncbi:hypothetical protein [Leyella stercorea]|uniref:hypothetical protein n=1 Tax=Leyella stercorea TaxID=363265 RepID=UPI0024317A89|nr:hypothetical protein [Leyella stercorea]